MQFAKTRWLRALFLIGAYLLGALGIIATGGGNGDDDDEPARSFGAPMLLETNPGDARQPKIAMDSTGNALVVWAQDNGTSYDIWANRYLEGGGWGIAELIENETGDASNQRLVVDVMGNGMVAWLQDNGTNVNLWSARYVMGTGWGTPELVENEPGDASSPAIATGPLGNVIAVWSQNNGVRDSIWANFYSIGTGWSTPVMIESGSVDAINPQVAMDPEGNAIVVWIRGDGVYKSIIWAKYYSSVTGWEATEHMIASSEERYSNFEARIGMDLAGNGMVVWASTSGDWWDGGMGAYASRYVQGSGWESWTRLSAERVAAYDPDIAMDSAGNMWAVWGDMTGIFSRYSFAIMANSYSVGMGWDEPEHIYIFETYSPSYWDGPKTPEVVMFDSGEALCVHDSQDGDIVYNVYRYYVFGDSTYLGWDRREIIDDGSEPDLAKGIADNAIVVYRNYDGAYTNIFASRYE